MFVNLGYSLVGNLSNNKPTPTHWLLIAPALRGLKGAHRTPHKSPLRSD